MVQVNLHLVVAYFQYAAQEVVAVLILQGDDGSLIDVLLVKLAVYNEYLTFQFNDACFNVLAVSLLRAQLKGKSLAFFQVLDVVLKRFEGKAEAANEVERTFVRSLFYEVFSFFIYGIEFVLHRDVLVDDVCHFTLLFIVLAAKVQNNYELCVVLCALF